ncbi:MAG: GNAT family N-acetyltransferase [Candidatus Cloacimonetes bacterium]|nr:GNAT family N-acetyltransferase [Candidatus Cloacimonadota bacterium]
MIDKLQSLKIIEYNEIYAVAIADMWNKSGDCWGGYNLAISEESVRQEEAQSDCLALWLAMIDEEVIGYCKLSEYREDEGALYIDLINVIPEYHGKKIGKKLVLKAVEKTIELGYPRVDLYTWTGNTKAVPLYKKTGFFWVDRDDCTHCMNFIPTVLTSELLKDYIADLDWYEDSQRKIAIEPDGKKHNGFECYRYHWKNDENELEVEFCRHSRGIEKIRTKDFEIIAETDQLKQVFGKSYEVMYKIRNFSEQPLDVKINGYDDRNIVFDYHGESRVHDEEIFIATFYVNEPKEKQSKWRTYPAVCADISINSKSQDFKVGIDPQFPLTIKVVGENKIYSTHHDELLHFNMKNNYNEKVLFSWELNDSDLIQWQNHHIEIELESEEQNTIAVPMRLLRAGVLHEKITIKASFQNGDTFSYSDSINEIFQTTNGIGYGKNERHIALINGRYQVQVDQIEFFNEVSFFDVTSSAHTWQFMFPPKIGKPYTSELHQKKASKVDFNMKQNAAQMHLLYEVEKPVTLTLILHFTLYSNGILEKWATVQNASAVDTPQEICLSNAMFVRFQNTVIPYKGKFIYIDHDTQNWGELYEAAKYDENWIFNYGTADTMGLSWPDDFKMTFSEELLFDSDLGIIPSRSSKDTKKFRLMLGTFKEWNEFRAFILDKRVEQKYLTDYLEVIVNDGNPFIDQQFYVNLTEYREKPYNIPVEYSAKYGSFETSEVEYSSKKETHPVWLTIDNALEYDILQAKIQGKTPNKVIKRVVFPTGKGEIKTFKSVEEDHKIWSCSNELISIKAAEEYAPTVHSLVYKDQEWIDSDFPAPGPKSWWNPWIGGINSYPHKMQMRSIIKEGYSIEDVVLNDNFRNEWKGIKISVSVNEFEKFKGLSWNQYYLMLPEVPVLCYVPEIIQETGRYLRNIQFISRYFAYADEKIGNCFVRSYNSKHEMFDYYSGKEAVDLYPQTVRAVGSTLRDHMIQIWTDQAQYNDISLNKDITSFWMYDYLNIDNNQRRFLTPKFLILTKELLSQDEIRDLRNITFSHSNNKGERL